MGFILLLLVVIALAMLASSMEKKANDKVIDKLVIQKKQCPPHQWFWQEIVDQDGIKQGDRLYCKVCGPLKPIGSDNEIKPY